MSDIDTKALNDKLLKFAGIEYKKYDIIFGGVPLTSSGYYLTNKLIRKTPPDLVHSLDAQRKYIYPKLDLQYIAFWTLNSSDGNKWTCNLSAYSNHQKHFYDGYSKDKNNPAIAFALAIEILIDNEGKNGN